MLIICFSVFFSVNNLSAQSVWEEVIEQWVNNQESNSYQLENLMNKQRKMMLLERDHTYTSI